MPSSKISQILISFLFLMGCASMGGLGKTGLELSGNLEQSGLLKGKTAPNAEIKYNGMAYNADENGVFIIGFDRDEKQDGVLEIISGKKNVKYALNIAPRVYQVTEVNGLPTEKLEPPPEVLARINNERDFKQKAFQSLNPEISGINQTWVWPLENIYVTSPWGAVRSLNGVLQKPHYGVDLRAKVGTNILASADGKVILAEPELFYEGGVVGIDHGMGLISFTMHMSRIDVKVGDVVKQGQIVGLSGATGLVNGPHVHWSMRWRGRQLDPSSMTNSLKPIKVKKLKKIKE